MGASVHCADFRGRRKELCRIPPPERQNAVPAKRQRMMMESRSGPTET